jgi:phage host-nuclease inhibitor protein Gam
MTQTTDAEGLSVLSDELLAEPAPEVPVGRTDEAEERRRQVAQQTVRRHFAITREIDQIEKQAANEIALIEEWKAAKLKPLRDSLAATELSLRGIGEAHLAAHPKGNKYLDVPSGRISWRTDQPKLRVLDKDGALDSVKAAGLESVIEVEVIPAQRVQKLSLTSLKKAVIVPERTQAGSGGELLPVTVEATGEVLAGLGWEISPDLTVKVEPLKIKLAEAPRGDANSRRNGDGGGAPEPA